ncbi:MAG: LPXTG cell wall anchor domain-containing protein, partial [Oscillospiraceae bacterium]|nr:LPXTG cell wall anchor domain-containing protein [Oscillospiraceae bacterium]
EGQANEEVMTTMTNNVKLTANGPQVTATGFSPYTVIWGTADELAEYAKKVSAGKVSTSLPQTGDDSTLLLWVALLTVCVAVLATKKRSRA